MASTTANNQSGLKIIRSSGNENQALVIDAYGDLLEAFPSEMTDEQIMFCIELIKKYFDSGVRRGEDRKMRQIKDSLDIN